MSRIAFFDVEDADKPLVLSRFPDALVLEPTLSPDEIVAACGSCEILSVFVTSRITKDIVTRLPALKLLCTRSVGFDHIDLEACKEKGVVVTHVPDYGAHVIAEHAFALLLSTLRFISAGHERVKAGRFDYRGLRGTALKGKTLGIVGTGKIGKQSARIAKGFGMRLLGCDPFPAAGLPEETGLAYVGLEQLLAESDIVTLHAPAMAENRHLMNDARFAQMKPGAVLVNTARGGIVDPDALLRALDNGKLSWALLDVLEHEENPALSARLIGHPSVVVTPHIAFYADDSMRAMYDDCFRSIDEWQDGERPAHAVA